MVIPAIVTDLLWTPVQADHTLDQFPIFWFDPGVDFRLPFLGESLRLFGPISSPSVITSEFSADCGLMDTDCFSDLCLVKACLQKCVDMVSLIVGKLCVGSHERSFELIFREALILPQLTALIPSKLHLGVEFKSRLYF